MFGTEIINNQEYIYLDGYVLVNNEWKKLEEMKDQKQPRTIKKLIKDFEKSAGNFESLTRRWTCGSKPYSEGGSNS